MRRLLALGLGLLGTLSPNRIVESAERLVFEAPDAGRLRPWTLPVARLKGVLFLALFVRRSERTTSYATPLAALGALLALAPRSMLRFGLRLAYENPNDLEVKPEVVPLARLLSERIHVR